jgi:serine/threonine-protein kinase
MITGENPFVRQNVVLSLEAIQRQPVTPPSVKRLDAGPLDVILERALEKRPEERYQDAHDMRDDLRNLLRSGAVRAPEMDLGSFLHELFRAEIEDEDRLLAARQPAVDAAVLAAAHDDERARGLGGAERSRHARGSRPPPHAAADERGAVRRRRAHARRRSRGHGRALAAPEHGLQGRRLA